MTFVLIQEREFEPFVVEIVAKNTAEDKALTVQFFINHVADWPESSLDEFARLGGKWKRSESLKKKAGSDFTRKEAGKLLGDFRALMKLVETYGIPEDEDTRAVWDTLTITQKSKIVTAWMNWTEEQAAESTEE